MDSERGLELAGTQSNGNGKKPVIGTVIALASLLLGGVLSNVDRLRGEGQEAGKQALRVELNSEQVKVNSETLKTHDARMDYLHEEWLKAQHGTELALQEMSGRVSSQSQKIEALSGAIEKALEEVRKKGGD